MALWVMSTVMKDGPASSLAVGMSPHKDEETSHRLAKTSEEQSSMYVEAVCFLLKSHATYFNTAKTASDIACLKETSTETSVQFSDFLRSKVFHCENASPKKRTIRVFIDDLSAINQSVLRMFWDFEQAVHLLKLAQYADTLLEQTRQVPSPMVAPAYRNRF